MKTEKSRFLFIVALGLVATLGVIVGLSACTGRQAMARAGAMGATGGVEPERGGSAALGFPRAWASEPIYAPKYFVEMRDRSLRFDSKGYPHIAYGGDHLYYARYDGS